MNIVVSLTASFTALLNKSVNRTQDYYRFSISIILALLAVHPVFAQTDTVKVEVVRMAKLDSITGIMDEDSGYTWKIIDPVYNPNQLYLDSATKKKRVLINTGLHVGLYASSLLILNQAWYAGYPRSNFHAFNDSKEWLQVDKVGHAWSAYQISRTSMASWKWAGLSPKQQVWVGGLAGATFQTVIEVLDGFSTEWGWSWSDFAANCVGSGLLISQQLAWHEQRISFKFSFHKMNYSNQALNIRSDSLFGSSLPERALKDYNGQTYWLSANLKSFFPKSNLPAWLNLSVGYGASGMYGAFDNTWKDANGSHDLSAIPRERQWYLAPDIDFTRIRTKSKLLKSVFFVLNAFKLPSPALVLTNGKLTVKGFYF